MSARRGAQFVPLGLPIICWKTSHVKTPNAFFAIAEGWLCSISDDLHCSLIFKNVYIETLKSRIKNVYIETVTSSVIIDVCDLPSIAHQY